MKPRRPRLDTVMAGAAIVAAMAWHSLFLQSDLTWSGDDWAHYLSHARNIAEQRPYGATGYIHSPYAAEVGPQDYPPGYPLLLAPVFRAVGLTSFAPYKVLGIATIGALLVLVAFWCRRTPPVIPAALPVATLGFNPAVNDYAVAVVSDPLFTVLVTAALLWADRGALRNRETAGHAIVTGLLVWAAALTRTVGLVLIAALLLRALLRGLKSWQPTAAAIVTAVVLTVLTEGLLTGSWTLDYSAQMRGYDWMTPLRNARLYAGDFALDVLVPGRPVLAKLGLLLYIGVAAVGLRRIFRERNGPTIWELFVGLYLVILLLWPSRQGTRFLLPLIPWMVRTGWIGIEVLRERLEPRPFARALPLVAAAAIALAYAPRLAAEARLRGTVVHDGVSTPAIHEMIEFLRHQTAPSAVVAGARPRAIALFTGRQAAAPPRAQVDRLLVQHLRNVGVTHLVLDDEYRHDVEQVKPVVMRNAVLFEPVFSNGRFTVLEIRRAELPGE